MMIVEYKLRKAVQGDSELLMAWANDEVVRRNSINTHTISFEEHERWFKRKLDSPDCLMLIFEVVGEPAGQLRFDHNAEEQVWEIGFSIAEKFRGQGLSKLLVTEAVGVLNKFPIVAYVKPDNIRSKNVFSDLQFTELGIFEIKNTKLIKFIKRAV